MLEALVYIGSSFWLGAAHAATPGHGKTVAAAYLVGARGRVVDAVVLGLVVTLAHTGGIVAFGILATLGSSALLPQRAEGYLALGTGLLIIGMGGWMLWSGVDDHDHEGAHHHGRGRRHADPVDLASRRPSLGLLLGLGVAGGIAPDPAALAVLLSAVATGKLVLGLMTVLVFSLGFASVLVAVGLVAARAGQIVLDRIDGGRWLLWVQPATATLIVVVGIVLTVGAWRTLETFR